MLYIAHDSSYVFDVPPGHRFPMEKYELLPRQLIHEGTVEERNFFVPDKINNAVLSAVHDEHYVERFCSLQLSEKEQRKTGFVHTEQIVQRELQIVEGTRSCAEKALETGCAMNVAGGTHHAFTDRGEGFCMLNDQAVAARWLLDTEHAQRVLIVDLDVHQGNGTAQIFQNDERVFTFSMHGKHNYPLHKEQSDRDVELEDGTSGKTYHYLLEKHLNEIMELHKPDFMFFQSGVDVLECDKLGRLKLSIEDCKRRDACVLQLAKKNGIPIVCSMGGGYSVYLRNIVEAHANTFRLAQTIFF